MDVEGLGDSGARRGPGSISGQNGLEGGLDSISPQLCCKTSLRVSSMAVGVDAVRLEGTPKARR